MPKFPKGFGRRKSTANAFEDVQDVPVVEHSFKVFERPDGGSKSFDGGVKLAKATTGAYPVGRPKTSHKEENMFEGIIHGNRSSGASNTNTASTTDNSSRLSAASTAPSSTDASRGEEGKSPHEKFSGDIPLPPIPKSQSPFSLKAAGRSLSWGRNNNKNSTPPPISKDLPSAPTEDEYQPRSRAVTASSYASTATPPKLDERDLGLSLGGNFSDMFTGFGKRKSAVLEPIDTGAMPQSPDISPAGPASRSYSSNRPNQPSPLNIDKNKNVEASPYSWSSQHSRDGLMSNSSPPPFAPQTENQAPPVPQHVTPSRTNNTSPNFTRQQRPGGLADTGLRRTSGYSGRRQSTVEYGEAVDEDARLLRESVNASRRLNEPSYTSRVRDSWALPSDNSYKVDDATVSSWTKGPETTPRPKKAQPLAHEDSMFDNHIAEAVDLAQRFEETSLSPPTQQTPKNKIMTPAQFERYKQDQERMRSLGGKSKDDEDEEDEIYDDEEDEAEKNKQLAKQRRKQEAHMAVYRQQMMKVTGESPAPTGGQARPPVFASQSSPNLNLGLPEEGEEEDEEVPLAILQAHGFPNKNKPPVRSVGSNPNIRAQSMAGAPLPVFARNLPQDPYFGASIVHPTNRESLAFSAGSVNGGTPRGLPVGGLVGVIATEERSRAMRRGSPNAQGEYGPPPSNGFNGMGMPINGSPSVGSGMGGMPPMGPMGPMNPMNPMMLTPGDQAQMQMSQQMQQFMQMQMQFMQMMTQGQGPPGPNGHMSHQFGDTQRPQSAQGIPQLRPGSSHQRAMSSLDPNSAPWMQHGVTFTPSIHPGGYAPSIAPSERSNVGLPGRYRPVSQVPLADNKSRASTMSGALQGWENKNGQATIKAVKKPTNIEDEDDEEGWEEMAKKREKKKTLWKSKKDSSGLKELLAYTQ